MNSMINKSEFSQLSRFGITKDFISHANSKISNFITKTTPKKITQPTIIFSDLHANVPALNATLKFAEENSIESFISLGDLIEYNTQNDEILEILQSLNSKFISSVRGNHDDGVVDENQFISSLFQERIRKDLGEFLLKLPENDIITVKNSHKKILLTHSNPWNLDVLYLFPENKNNFEYFFKKLPFDGFMFGHTHFLTFYESYNGLKFAFNPGSLGVSRDGNKTLHFSVLEPEGKKIVNYELDHADEDYLQLLSNTPIKISEYKF